MFDRLSAPKPDPILSIAVAFKEDTRPDKIDLGIGVYRDSLGNTPIMSAVKKAQNILAETQITKSYVGLAGDEAFNTAMIDLLLKGTQAYPRAMGVQTPGASGALRMLADLIAKANPDTTVWISNPSYVNHRPVMEAAGLNVQEYPYFDPDTKAVNESAMLDQIAKLGSDDVLLLHGCCHNPTGADISLDSWKAIAELAVKNGFTPFVDIAYQGFGDGLQEDAEGLRYLADTVDEMVIATSCSKNFGLYRERTGAAIVIGKTIAGSAAAKGRILEMARATYTMPPDHGAAIVSLILHDRELREEWENELDAMNGRINGLRQTLADAFQQATDSNRFDYFRHHRGMFSVTGLSDAQIEQLREERGIYIVGGGRVNIAGLRESDIETVVQAFLEVGA